jgi:hypothetical protein
VNLKQRDNWDDNIQMVIRETVDGTGSGSCSVVVSGRLDLSAVLNRWVLLLQCLVIHMMTMRESREKNQEVMHVKI